MNDAREQTGREADQVIQLDLSRVRRLRVNNLTGNTFIKGTRQSELRVRTTARGIRDFAPEIEFKHDGTMVEISVPEMVINVNGRPGGFEFEVDPFGISWPTGETDPDAGDDDEVRRQTKNAMRQARGELRDYARKMRDAARQERGKWGFNLDTLNEIARNIGDTFSQAFGTSGELYLEVPEGLELEFRTVSGVLQIQDISGVCQIKGTSGPVQLDNLSGGLRLKTVSGPIAASRLGGRVEINTVSSNVSLTDCAMSALDLSVTSGAVLVETRLAEPQASDGDYRINGTSAPVKLRLPASTSASIQARSLSGRISTPPGATQNEVRNRPGQNQARVTLNGGGRRISLSSISGNIEIETYEAGGESQPLDWSAIRDNQWPGVPPVPPVPPTPPVPPVPPVVGWEAVPPSPPVWGAVPPTPPTWGDVPFAASEPVATPSAPRMEQAQPEAEPAVAAAPVAPDGDQKNRQFEILRAIEQGTLSVEDGMAQLGNLD